MSETQATPRLWTTHRDGEVVLRLSKYGPGHETPVTIPELFQESVKRFGACPALAWKIRRKSETLSFTEYYEACRKAGRALIKLGLQRFHGVGILGFNSAEWLFAALGAILAGGLCVGIYATSSASACQYIITHAKVNILVVENDQQLQKILSIPQSRLETLKAIVLYKPELKKSTNNVYSWDDFMELGNSVPDTQLDQIIQSQKVNQCAMVNYTSGTVGDPKAVMLSHDNITWTAGAVVQALGLPISRKHQEQILSYLPLSHIAAQMMDIWVPMKIGALTHFAQPDALKGTLVSTLKEVKPTIFFGVPRIWEKLQETIKGSVTKFSSFKRKMFLWAKMVGSKVHTRQMLGRADVSMNYRMAKQLVFSKIKSSLGLDHCHSFLSGAAPLCQETSEFFLSLDIPIGETYGMSESSGPHSVSSCSNYRVFSCGQLLSGCKNLLLQENEASVGEVCVWGRHVFMGYLDREDATREAVDQEGWLHSGDLGRVDSQGFLYITGRIKELLITTGGENVAPVPIEALVKKMIPIVSNAVLVGDQARFLSMLLTLKCQTNQVSGEPLDKLTLPAIDFCRALGSQASTVSEILSSQDPLVYAAIQQGIDAVNQEATSNAQRIRKWAILEKDFSVSGGELDGTKPMVTVEGNLGEFMKISSLRSIFSVCYWTTERDGEVRLRLGRDANGQEAPLTVHDMVMHSAAKYVNHIALGTKRRNHWHLLTYGEYYEQCRRAAKGFLKLGLERFHGVGILGLNSEEWVIANVGAIMAGGFSVGILSTATPKACQIIAKNSEINVFVVDTDKQLQKIIQIQGSLKHLKAVVQYEDAIQTAQPNLYSWQSFLDLGSDISDEALDHVIDSQKPNQCCTLVYSVGATGPPKVIMLSHDNITWTTAVTAQSLCCKFPPGGQEVLVSYLPLSYICAQIFDMWLAIAVGGALYFSPQEAKSLSEAPHPPGAGYLTDLLREVQPTTFAGTPWVWDRMMDGLRTSQLAATALRRRVDTWAMQVGLRTNKRRMFGDLHSSLSFRLAKKLTFGPALKLLGLGRCEQFLSMGAGLPRATLDFFLSLDVPIYELYGLAECTGVHAIATRQDFRLLSGKGLPNTRIKVKEEDEEGIGSISIWGRNVFMGYLSDNENTMRKTDCYGWLHTGDLGFLDVDNFLYIRGNVKDIITLSSGEMINPSPIEERVKAHIPIVHYVMVVGQDAPYLCALLTLKCQVNWETGEPRTALTSETVALCRGLGSQATRLMDVVHNCDPVIADFISKGMEAVNAEAASDSARVVKWAVLDTDFSVSGGELGVTSRLKRVAVAKMYEAEIEHFYKDARSL